MAISVCPLTTSAAVLADDHQQEQDPDQGDPLFFVRAASDG